MADLRSEDRYYLSPCPQCGNTTMTSDGVSQPKTRPVVITRCETCESEWEFKKTALDTVKTFGA